MKNRNQELLIPIFINDDLNSDNMALILTSASDVGVIRNFGRSGARFAPKSILSQLVKLNNHFNLDKIECHETTNKDEEVLNFENAQEQSSKKISKLIREKNFKKLIHIGGGHDHIFPLLKGLSLSKSYKNILILNLDAHNDTRVADIQHSGTPFRDFDKSATLPFHLVQIGTSLATNSKSTLSPLKNGTTTSIYLDQLEMKSQNFTMLPEGLIDHCPFLISKETAIIISLDCDAIDGASMKGVSAVNGRGIPIQYIFKFISDIQNKFPDQTALGIYEYNPVYDDLSALGARSMARLMFEYLLK